MPQVLIIDDDASARTDLRAKLAAHPGVVIVGEAAALRSARALLTDADYDLVFLDVQLIGGESFQLVPVVRPGASIVFTTAHERYAVRAFECAAVDYLLKPISPVRLAEALHRAAVARVVNRAPTRQAPGIVPLGLCALPAMPGNFSEVTLTHSERVFLRQCLEAWEDALPPTHTLRDQCNPAARHPRAVRYEPGTEPTRLFLAATPVSCARRWWRALRACLGATGS
jgi:DNA-binding LytR/AlgR family response regulator